MNCSRHDPIDSRLRKLAFWFHGVSDAQSAPGKDVSAFLKLFGTRNAGAEFNRYVTVLVFPVGGAEVNAL